MDFRQILSHFTEGFRPLVLKSTVNQKCQNILFHILVSRTRRSKEVEVTGTVVRKIARFVLETADLLLYRATSYARKLEFPAFLASADLLRERGSPFSQFLSSAQVSHNTWKCQKAKYKNEISSNNSNSE